VPSEDVHGSEHVAAKDKRREFISGQVELFSPEFQADHHSLSLRFTGLSGQAIIAPNSAYLLTDSRYWTQAQEELDHNWTLVKCGSPGAPQNWIEWLVVLFLCFIPFCRSEAMSRVEWEIQESAWTPAWSLMRMEHLSESRLKVLNLSLFARHKTWWISSGMSNLITLLQWCIFTARSLLVRPYSFFEYLPLPTDVILVTGESADSKLERLKEWIRQQPASIHSYSKQQEALASRVHVATLVTSLSCIGRC